METFTLINFWKVVFVSRIPNFRGVKRHYYEITTIFTFFLSLRVINLVNFYPVTRFLVTPLLVSRYCVTLFGNTQMLETNAR